jgi:hypothetical protein
MRGGAMLERKAHERMSPIGDILPATESRM